MANTISAAIATVDGMVREDEMSLFARVSFCLSIIGGSDLRVVELYPDPYPGNR